jgi:TPR repeat protein
MAQSESSWLIAGLLLGLLASSTPIFADDYADARTAVRMRDYQKAYTLYKKLGNQGHVDAQYHLAAMYRSGRGVTKDHKRAAYWYRKAAEQGHVKAQYNLGGMYENGWGVTEDPGEAVAWYSKAAAQGHDKSRLPSRVGLRLSHSCCNRAQMFISKIVSATRLC